MKYNNSFGTIYYAGGIITTGVVNLTWSKTMNFECKICAAKMKRGSGHIKAKHQITTLEYVEKYENIKICELYEQGQSANKIASLIKDKKIGISPTKKHILEHLRKNGIRIRTTSEAIKAWNKEVGGPWNKGKTAKDHPSIAKQAEKVSGRNNSYYRMDEDARAKTRYWEYKSEEELFRIRRSSGDTHKERIRKGEIVPHIIRNKEWAKELKRKQREGYRRWLLDGNKVRFGNQSVMEKRIGHFLEEHGYTYVKQKSFGRFRYDYCLEEHKILIEYNGDYWHCNPEIYEEGYYNQKKSKTAKEIWEHDQEKIDKGKEKGYTVIVFWEKQFKLLTNKEISEVIDEAIRSEISKKTSRR